MPRPFRFAVQVRGAATGAEWREKARRAEALGFDLLSVADHFGHGLGAVASLAATAAATTTLRLGSYVVANDFRHPAVLAKEAATIDLLSEGRLELGIGAGWLRAEYEAAGIPFDPPAVRVARLEEAIRLVKRLFADGPTTFVGEHYRVTELDLAPTPAQRPHPPILVGGGGRRLLEVAGRHADIVGLAPAARGDGTLDPAGISAAATERKLGWLYEAAGPRFDALELNVFVYAVETTGDERAAAERLAAEFDLPAPELLASPHALFGSVDGMVATLRDRRDRFGISSITVVEDLMDAIAPVVNRLSGT
jgi:probable F420-dependent oxidoreductase